MKMQKEIFRSGEGDSWYDRNRETLEEYAPDSDVIVRTLQSLDIVPSRVLEIGCSSGQRLQLITDIFGAECAGVDPSAKAIAAGGARFPRLSLHVATADDLPFDDGNFDLIIFGFCLYLCDRKDLFRIAQEADRCLSNNGTLIINDFLPPFPYRNPYSHFEGVDSYKMDYGKMFTWNPAYSEMASLVYSHGGFRYRDIPDERVATVVLRKCEQYAYPDAPFA